MKEDSSTIIEAKEKLRKTQLNLLAFNEDDPSNYIDENHKGQLLKALEEALAKAQQELTQTL